MNRPLAGMGGPGDSQQVEFPVQGGWHPFGHCYRVAWDGEPVFEAREGVFDRFWMDAVSFWCDAERPSQDGRHLPPAPSARVLAELRAEMDRLAETLWIGHRLRRDMLRFCR